MCLSRKVLILIICTILLFIYSKNFSFASDSSIILLTSDRGLVVSDDNLKSWKDFNRGLPDNILPVKIQDDNSGHLYLLTQYNGIFTYNNTNKKWEELNSPEFLEPSFNLASNKYRRISAFDADQHGNLILATGHTVYKKENNGSWNKISDYNLDNYFTALKISNNKICAGTSNSGIYILNGPEKLNISSNLPKEPYSTNYSFREEIAGILFVKDNPEIIYLGLNFGGGIFVSKNNGKSWTNLNLPVSINSFYDIDDMKISNNSLFVSTSKGIYKLENNNWQLAKFDYITKIFSSKQQNLAVFIIDKSGNNPSLFYKLNTYKTKKKQKYAKTFLDKRVIYTNIYSLNKKLDYYVDTIKRCGLNGIVIDVKDDWGTVCFSSQNKTAKEIGAVKNYADIKKTLIILKKENIYTIARIVVFKDKYLYNAYNYKYAIWDLNTKSPWKGNPKEFWNDPYSDFVRNYNIEIAEEIQKLGFDEIQFDYIRFPSDGHISGCYYRYKNSDKIYKSEILAHFLEQAKTRIAIPISVDIYGFNAWFRISHLIGQDAERFAEIVDVLCPMIYPSHYGRNFYLNIPVAERPYKIVLDSVKRSVIISMGNAAIRPYLQAFKMLSPTWGPDYVNSQVNASVESGCSGFTFWNAGGNYDMVRKAIADQNGK
jgi:hypothetical protein